MANLEQLETELAWRFRAKRSDHWLSELEERGVPCGPVCDTLQALADPQTIAREMVVEVEHSTIGAVKTLGLPVKFSQTPGKVRTGAPVYGEHTRDILRGHGFGDEEIAALEAEGVIVAFSSGKNRQKVA